MFRHERATTSCALRGKRFPLAAEAGTICDGLAWLKPCLPRSKSESTTESKSRSKATDSRVRSTRSKSPLPNSLGRADLTERTISLVFGLKGQREGKTRPGDFLKIMATSGRG